MYDGIMTFDTRFAVAFDETPEMEELMEFAEKLQIEVTPDLDYADMPFLALEKSGHPRMEISALDEGENVTFDWAFAPGDDLHTGSAVEVKEAISKHFA